MNNVERKHADAVRLFPAWRQLRRHECDFDETARIGPWLRI